MPGYEEVISHMLPAVYSKLVCIFRFIEQLLQIMSCPIQRISEDARISMRYLERDASTADAMTGLAFHNASVTVNPNPSFNDF